MAVASSLHGLLTCGTCCSIAVHALQGPLAVTLGWRLCQVRLQHCHQPQQHRRCHLLQGKWLSAVRDQVAYCRDMWCPPWGRELLGRSSYSNTFACYFSCNSGWSKCPAQSQHCLAGCMSCRSTPAQLQPVLRYAVNGLISQRRRLSLLSSKWRPACHRHLTACSWPGAALLKVAINSNPTDAGNSMPKAVSPRRPASPGSPRLKLGAHRGPKGGVSDTGVAVERSADSVLNALAKAEEEAVPKVSTCHLRAIRSKAGCSQHCTS